jgi:hypothetical protein
LRNVNAGALNFQAIGIILLTGFGAVWLLSAATFARALDWRAWLGVGLGVSALTLGAVRKANVAQQIGHAMALPGISPLFWIVVAVMWVLIFAAMFVLARRRRRDLVISLVALIVGLHFLPLAWIFGAHVYYLTGGFIVLTSLAAFALRDPVQRQGATCLACGIVLWLTSSAVLLVPQ